MGGKPKAPKPTAQELELQRRQRTELDELTRDRNASLKAIKRTLGGRRTLLGSGGQTGITDGGGRGGGAGAGSPGGRGGGILTGGAGPGRTSGYRGPTRRSAL